MKGRTHGDAQVSLVHANWIINRGRATASDVASLINMGRAAVFERFNIRLQLEVLLVGEWDPDSGVDTVQASGASDPETTVTP